MADDKKVKKKKSKKTEKEAEPAAEAAPAPAPEPVKAAEPAPEGDDWLSAASEPAPEAAEGDEAAPAAEGDAPAPAEGEVALAEGEEMAEPPPAPKKKPVYFVHWNRRKPKFYDYNFDYGTNYYSSVVNYIDSKSLGTSGEIPRRMAFAERGINSSIERKSRPDQVTESILNEVRSSIRGFENFQRSYVLDSQRRV